MERIRNSFYKHWELIFGFVIASITVLIYIPSLKNEFVNFDDQSYVYENPFIKVIDSNFFKWIFTSFHSSNWHPLTWISHATDYALWGLNPAGHHLTSVILHGLNTFLVVLTIKYTVDCRNPNTLTQKDISVQRYFRFSLIVAAVTGLLFGLHPLHVESVAWVSERKDVLCAFFFLLSVLSYLKYAKSDTESESRITGRGSRAMGYILCLFFYILALMSKPMTVTLPLVLLLLDIFPLRRFELSFHEMWKNMRSSHVLSEKLPFFILGLASSLITIKAQQSMGALKSFAAYPLDIRALVSMKAPVFYLFKMLRPEPLAPLYLFPSHVSFFSIPYIGSLLLEIALFILFIYLWVRKQQRAWLIIYLYFLVTLLPVLGIIQVGEQEAADRYTYLPSLGPFLAAGMAIAFLWGKAEMTRHSAVYLKVLLSAVSIILTGLMCLITIRQIAVWKDSSTLWNAELRILSVEEVPQNKVLSLNEKAKYMQEIASYNGAIMKNPFFTAVLVNRGVNYALLSDYRMAAESFRIAIMLNPGDMLSYNNRGNVHAVLGNYKEAISDYDAALRLAPRTAALYRNRGLLYREMGELALADRDFRLAANLQRKRPGDAEPAVTRVFFKYKQP